MGKKTILVVFGSPRPNGATARLLKPFLEVFGEGFEVCRYDAYTLRAAPCLACGACKKAEVCALRDLDAFDRDLRRADALLFATPVYNLGLPAPAKAILDRTQRYFEARFSLGLKPNIEKPKRAALLCVCGSKSDEGVSHIARQLSMAFTVMNTTLDETVVLTGTDGEHPEWEAALQRAREAALAIKHNLCYNEI